MPEAIVVWFNPRCSKCRAVRDLLERERGPYLLRHYLDEPPAPRELADVLRKLGPGADVRTLGRTTESAWTELGLDDADDATILATLASRPELIQRPIAIRGERAVVARPPERVRELL